MKTNFLPITIGIITLMFIGTSGYAQLPNLGKIKDKVTSKAKTTVTEEAKKSTSTDNKSTTTSGSDKGTTAGAADGKPEYDPESPVYRAYSIVRDESNSVRYQLKEEEWTRNQEGRNADAEKYWNNAKTNLEKLREAGESNKPYFKTFEAELTRLDAERKEKWNNYTLDQQYDGKLEAYYKFAAAGWEIRDTTLEPSYKGYYAFRKDFEESRPEKYKNSYVQSRVTTVNNYFAVEVYKVIPRLQQKVEGVIKNIHEKNSRNEESYMLNAKNYVKSFDEPAKEIAHNKKYLMEKTDEIDALQAKIDQELAMLNEYISSGKCDAHVAKYRQEIIDAVRMGKSAMTNATYENMAKGAAAKDGTVKRVSITSATWYVKKNDFGFPLYKYLPVDIAVTDKDGKCWLTYGQVRMQYEGGGTYGGEYFDFWGKQDEMNCANINK